MNQWLLVSAKLVSAQVHLLVNIHILAKEGLTIPMGLKNWGPWHGCAHVNNAPSGLYPISKRNPELQT